MSRSLNQLALTVETCSIIPIRVLASFLGRAWIFVVEQIKTGLLYCCGW